MISRQEARVGGKVVGVGVGVVVGVGGMRTHPRPLSQSVARDRLRRTSGVEYRV